MRRTDDNDARESSRVGAEVFPSSLGCACVHIGKLSKLVFIAGARRLFVLRLHGIHETQPSLLWVRRGHEERRATYERKSESFNKSGCHAT